MPANLTIDSPDSDNPNVVTIDHFGLNFVADYERIGERPWERYDEVIDRSGAGNIRYPGGITAETVFDISNPNAGFVVLENGGTRQMMGAFDFAEFANANGFSASFIIPTAHLLEEIPGQALRGFNEEFLQDVIDYVMGVLIASGGNISTFEIGNEYESHMTSAEYGILVNALAPIIYATIEDYNDQFSQQQSDAQISVQVWSHFSNEDTIYDTDNLYTRTDRVIEQFDEEALDAIGALVTHWYVRDHGRSYIDVYYDIEADILDAMSVLDHFADSVERDFDLFLSEWNTNRTETIFFGLAQVSIMIRMFAEFVQAGLDQLDFWSGQYHPNSLALPNGELTAAGVAFAYMEEVAVGSNVFDLTTDDFSIGGVAFVSEELTVLSLSNLTDSSYNYTFTSPEGYDGPIVISIGSLEVDTSESDGSYRDFYDLEIYHEPDLEGEIVWTEISLGSGETVTIEFDPYQTIFVEFPIETADIPSAVIGSSGNDHFLFATGNNSFDGADGVDTIDFSESESRVAIWTDASVAEISESNSLISFEEIEVFIGSTYDDRFSAYNGDFEVHLGVGNDNLFLGEFVSGHFWMQQGDDFIIGYSSSAFIYAGDGDDIVFSHSGMTIDGGRGDDVFYSMGISDTFIFGLNDGNDTIISFDPSHDQLTLESAVIDAIENFEFEIISSENGAIFNLLNGGSIEFVSLVPEDVSDIIDQLLQNF